MTTQTLTITGPAGCCCGGGPGTACTICGVPFVVHATAGLSVTNLRCFFSGTGYAADHFPATVEVPLTGTDGGTSVAVTNHYTQPCVIVDGETYYLWGRWGIGWQCGVLGGMSADWTTNLSAGDPEGLGTFYVIDSIAGCGPGPDAPTRVGNTPAGSKEITTAGAVCDAAGFVSQSWTLYAPPFAPSQGGSYLATWTVTLVRA